MSDLKLTSNLFEGSLVPDEFLNDRDAFLKLDSNVQKEVIRNVFLWYPKPDVEEEWNSWLEGKGKDEEKALERAVKLILFILKEGLVKRFTDEDFSNEFAHLGFEQSMIDFFLHEVRESKNSLLRRIEESETPIIKKIEDIRWRVDIKKASSHSRRIDEPTAILALSLSGAKSEEIVLELSPGEIKSLQRTFQVIEEEIKKQRTDFNQ